MAGPADYFQALMERIRCRSEQIAVYMAGNNTYPRRWMDPPDRGWDGDPSVSYTHLTLPTTPYV